MQYKKLVYLALVVMCMVPLAEGASSSTVDPADYHYAQWETIDVKRTCINNGTFCGTVGLACNATIQTPTGANLINNSPMTVNSAWANITIGQVAKNERSMGYYLVTQSCCAGGVCGAESFKFEVTADGNPSKPFPIQFGIMLACFFLLVIGLFMKEHDIMKVIPAMGLMAMGVVTLYPGYSYINWSTLTGLLVGSIAIGMGAFFVLEPYFSKGEQAERFTDQDLEEDDDGSD